MAQLAEQLTCNQQVNGSSPFIGLKKYGWIPEWPKGADCKSVSNAFEGSNPSPPISFFYFKDKKGIKRKKQNKIRNRKRRGVEQSGSSPGS